MSKFSTFLFFILAFFTFLNSTLFAQTATLGSWGPVLPSTVIPVAVANLPNGKLLTWSSYDRLKYGLDSPNGRTFVSIFDPTTNTFTERLVAETGHDMFCPGIANLPDGKILVSGGSSSSKTTIYDPVANTFVNSNNMNTPRGYNSNITLPDGRVFTLGGSWSGGRGNKNAEVWSQIGSWTPYPGITADATVRDGSPDPGGVYRDDNHGWLWVAPNGKIFHAGPGKNMHWLDLGGTGSVQAAGARGDDTYAMNGTTVMYDIGKILKAGGAAAYNTGPSNSAFDPNVPARNTAHTIDINNTVPVVTKVGDMAYARALHNSVVLPNGEVVVAGGMPVVVLFSDLNAHLSTEIWSPQTNSWRTVAPMSVPRTYHSTAILLQDGRVWFGGGGLCNNCPANHPDAQIYTPPYLYDSSGVLATRPVINTSPATTAHNTAITVTTNEAITNFALVRLSSSTHSTNNEQRRIPLTFTATGTNTYSLTIPDANIAVLGYYFLFAMNSAGVPSVAKVIKIGNTPLQTQVVPNGTYFINSVASTNQRLMSPSAANTTVRMAARANKNEQKWQIIHLGYNVYSLKNVASGRFMAVPGGTCVNSAAVATSTTDTAAWNRWIITKQGNDYFFRPVHCQTMGLDRNTANNLAAIIKTFSAGNNNQKFRLTSTSPASIVNATFESPSEYSGNGLQAFNKDIEVTPTDDRRVDIRWIVNQRQPVSNYILQHATEDDEEFVNVKTFIPNDKTGIQYYNTTTDVLGTGENFYRILIEFANGMKDSTAYHPVFFEEKRTEIDVFPNPAREELFVDMSAYMGEEVSYLISSSSGQILTSGVFSEGHGKQERISLEKLGEGLYFIYTKPDNQRETVRKFVVKK